MCGDESVIAVSPTEKSLRTRDVSNVADND